MKRSNRLKILGVTVGAIATGVLAMSGTNYTLTEALNLLASAGSSQSGYTAQEAANILVAQQAATLASSAPRDSLVGMITFIYDDVVAEQWDSIKIFQPAKAGPGTYPASYNWNYSFGVAMEPQNVLYGDSTNSLSPANVRAMNGRGVDFGTVGWDEKASLWSGQTGKVATGAFTSLNAFEDMFSRARQRSTLDSLGITAQPRWVSWSNSSQTAYQKAIVSKLGYEFGYGPSESASGASTQGTRPNQNYALFEWSGADTLMTGSAVACTPGWQTDRYEILQCLGEGNSSIQTKRAIWRAIQTKGLCVVILHRPSSWKTSLTASAADTLGYGGKLNCMSRVLWFCNRYVQAGLLRVVTPSEAADWFYNRPISPGANWTFSNFRDVDRSIHTAPTTQYRHDNWMSFTSNSSLYARPVPKALLSNPTAGGYGGKNYVKMNWTTSSRNVWARASARPWNQNNSTLWVVPPKGGEWTAHFEVFAIQDTTVASGTTAAGDSIGVTFTAVRAGFTNNFNILQSGTSNLWPMFSTTDLTPSGVLTGEFSTSTRFNAGADQFGNVWKFEVANNTIARGTSGRKEWLHVVTSWEYPGNADILFVSVWHGTNNASGEIRLSNPHLSFSKNSPPGMN